MKLTWALVFVFIIGINLCDGFGQNGIIIDHNNTNIHDIPDRWIDSAQHKLVVFYGHASHGSHITNGGMTALMNFSTEYAEKYRFNIDGSNGGLRIIEPFEPDWYDLSHNSHDWFDRTVSMLTDYPEINVVMWAWSGMYEQDIDAYITQMEQLISIYGPGGSAGRNVQFVYQTGNNDENHGDAVVSSRKQIKDHCIANNRILYDFTDIESYTPDGDFYGEYDSEGIILPRAQRHFLNEDLSYDMDGASTLPGNWGLEWMDANPNNELTALAADEICTSCAHSMGGNSDDNSRLHCVLKGMAGWYLFARLAGWDGSTASDIPVTDIEIVSAGNANTISTENGTLQLSANILPANATNQGISWTVQNGSGQASINQSGLVTALANGTITAVATATDGSGVSGSFTITISNQPVEVNNITITSPGNTTTISTYHGTLQLSAAVLPVDATNTSVTWSIQNGTGEAGIDQTGLVNAISNGTVTAIATASDGSGVSGSFVITLSNQSIPVTDITISSANNATTISDASGTLQLSAEVLPANASNQNINWSIQNGTGQARINQSGLVTALADGTVTATAAATDGSGVSGEFIITISNQPTLASDITITSAGNATTISTYQGTLQLSTEVFPAHAIEPDIVWSIQNGTGQATVNSSGIVTAIANGTVTVLATVTDLPDVSDSFTISISNQVSLVTNVTITSEGDVNSIDVTGGTLQLYAEALPTEAFNRDVSWYIQNETGRATITQDGLVTAMTNGTVTATAQASDGSGISETFDIIITNQAELAEIRLLTDGDVNTINSSEGTLQMYVNFLPVNAPQNNIVWEIQNITGEATVDDNGLVQALQPGIVSVVAISANNSEIRDYYFITINDQNPNSIVDNYEHVNYHVDNRTIYLDNTKNLNQLRVIDTNGRIIKMEHDLKYKNSIELYNVREGIYIIQCIYSNHEIKNNKVFIR